MTHDGFRFLDRRRFRRGPRAALDFKGVGTSAANTQAKRCHVLILHETAVSITESGCLASM